MSLGIVRLYTGVKPDNRAHEKCVRTARVVSARQMTLTVLPCFRLCQQQDDLSIAAIGAHSRLVTLLVWEHGKLLCLAHVLTVHVCSYTRTVGGYHNHLDNKVWPL